MSGATSSVTALFRRQAVLVMLAAVLGLAGCGGGGSGSDLSLGPPPDQGGDGDNGGEAFDFSTAMLTIEGPDTVSPNSSSDYVATLLDENGVAPPGGGLFVSIQPTQGIVNPPGGANTDAAGEVNFSYTAPNADQPRTEQLRANVSSGSSTLSTRLDVMVTPDVFQFTVPQPNRRVPPGDLGLQLEWFIGGEPVDTGEAPPAGGAGPIMLSLSGDGVQGGFVVGTDALANPVMVDLVDGEFADVVRLTNSGNPGNAVVTATADGGFTASLPLMFVGQPSSLDLSADPTTIGVTGASNLRAVARDSAGNLLENVTLVFEIQECAGGVMPSPDCPGGDRIEAGQQTDVTDATGVAESIYRAGSSTGGAIVRVRTQAGGNVVDTIAINVAAAP